MTTSMKVFVLTENNAGELTAEEHGLSYLIESDGRRILFDTGQSDLFLKNAAVMGVSLEGIDMIVLSHGHYDHGNGLEHLGGGKLLCHPGCFVKRYRKADKSYIGLKNTKDELEKKFALTFSSVPFPVSDKIFFLGEIPRITSFESRTTSFVHADGTPDFVMDDSAIAIILSEGLFVVTGCGHAGVVNTLIHAKNVTGVDKVYGIMGGFHLKEDDHQTRETIRYLETNNVTHVLPSHCTTGEALIRFHKTVGVRPVKTGMNFQF
jgi:7,8-dihydropterin-6-yl-methyl-4-(beta-D-ribofuranosyl)aminobenzene 5'-phosphate synthase